MIFPIALKVFENCFLPSSEIALHSYSRFGAWMNVMNVCNRFNLLRLRVVGRIESGLAL